MKLSTTFIAVGTPVFILLLVLGSPVRSELWVTYFEDYDKHAVDLHSIVRKSSITYIKEREIETIYGEIQEPVYRTYKVDCKKHTIQSVDSTSGLNSGFGVLYTRTTENWWRNQYTGVRNSPGFTALLNIACE